MTGFESFDVRAWLVDGLTKHVSATAKRSQQARQASFRSRVIVPVILAGMAVSTMPPATACGSTGVRWISSEFSAEPPVAQHRAVGDAAQYWTARIAEVRSWRVLQESDHAEPPELY